jgi:hypothetical protein
VAERLRCEADGCHSIFSNLYKVLKKSKTSNCSI